MKKITSLLVVICMMFSAITCAYAYDGSKTQLEQIDKRYPTSSWAKSTSDTLDIAWGESPTRNVLKGEFMFAVLRAIQSCMLRLSNTGTLSAWTSLEFDDANTLTKSAKEEAKILVQYGILTGYNNKMQLGNTLKRSEAAKILSCFNSLLNLEKVRSAPNFTDISGHWAEEYIKDAYMLGMINGKSDSRFDPDGSMTLEQTMQTIFNLVGKTAISDENLSLEYIDVACAMHETFKVVDDTGYQMPKNADIYPYIDESIPAVVYETDTTLAILGMMKLELNPKEVYKIYGEVYDDSARNVKKYFDYILNVDYRTIDADKFLDNINPYVTYDLSIESYGYLEDIQEYVDYVKENKIILKGKATPCFPVIYSDGLYHFLRTKIEFEVINSDTDENLLFWDEYTTYSAKQFSVYVDVPVSPSYPNKTFRVFNYKRLMRYLTNIKVDE